MFQLTNISIAIFVATLLNIFTTYTSWQRRKTKGGIYFAVAMLGFTFWTLFAAFDYAATSIPLKIFFAKLEILGYGTALPLMSMFTIIYAGHEEWLKKNWFKFSLVFLAASSILLVLTDSLHGLVWSGWILSDVADNVLIFEHGPAFTWITFTGYFYIVVILLNLLQVGFSGPIPSRKQARMLLLALIVPVGGNVIYLSNVSNTPGVDWSSISFSIAGLFFLIALYGSRLLDIVPIARNILIERMLDGILVLDNNGYLIDFNPAAQSILNINKDHLWTPAQITLARWPELVAALADSTTSKLSELSIGTPSKIFDIHLIPLENSMHQVYGQLMVLRDITEKKQAEEALRKSEAYFREVFDNTAHGTFIVDLTEDGNFRFGDSNKAEEFLTGLSRDATKGKLLDEAFPQEIAQVLRANYVRTIQNGTPISYEEDIDLPGIGPRSYYTTVAPVQDGSGRFYRIIGSTLEISERKRMENALRVSEERFRTLLMSTPDVILGTDQEGEITFANQAAYGLLGYSQAELIGKNVDQLLPFAVQDRHHDLRNQFLADPQSRLPAESGRELTAWHKDGHAIPVDIRLGYLQTDNNVLVIVVMNDISARKIAEERLRQTQNQLWENQRAVAVIEERQRLARDLHDSVSQSLHSVNLLSETLTSALAKGNSERSLQLSERVQEGARQALKEARLMLYQLQPSKPEIEVDLLRDIETRLSSVERRAGVKATVILDGSVDDYPAMWKENLFWITIEALNNALKHAQARNIKIIIRSRTQSLELEIMDDGIGFDAARIYSGGMGLRNMRERAELLGGQLSFKSAPGMGTSVIFQTEVKLQP